MNTGQAKRWREAREARWDARFGEGSRGGKIIGHTKSGKPIYFSHSHPSHGDFTKKEHQEAAEIHVRIYKNFMEKGKEGKSITIHHKRQAEIHTKRSAGYFTSHGEARKAVERMGAVPDSLNPQYYRLPNGKRLRVSGHAPVNVRSKSDVYVTHLQDGTWYVGSRFSHDVGSGESMHSSMDEQKLREELKKYL